MDSACGLFALMLITLGLYATAETHMGKYELRKSVKNGYINILSTNDERWNKFASVVVMILYAKQNTFV